MSQPATTHDTTRSAPETGAAEVDQKARSLLSLVNILRNVASDRSFIDIEATYTELCLLRQRDQGHTQKVQQLEAKLMEIEIGSGKAKDEREKQHDLHTRQLLRNYREEVATVEAEKANMSQQLLAAQSIAKDKEEEATKLQKANADLNKHIEDAMSKMEEAQIKTSKDQQEIAMLLSKVKDKEQMMQKQKETLSRQGTTIESTSSDNKALRKDLNAVRSDLEKCRTSLAAVQAFATPLQEDDVSKTSEQFDALWKQCVAAVYRCFANDLHESVLQDSRALDGLQSSEFFEHRVPLALSNSGSAKVGRSIVVLALISRLMVDRIFKPTRLAQDDFELRRELYYLAQADRPKEAFTRGLLLSLEDAESQETYILGVVQQAYQQIKSILNPDPADKFRRDLQAIFSQTARLWRDLQSRKSHFEVDFELPEDPSSLWKSVKFSSTDLNFREDEVMTSAFATDAIGAKVFPRMSRIGPHGEVLVIPTKVVQMSQMESMRQEIAQMFKPSGTWRRTTASLEKKKSLSSKRRDTEQNGSSFLQ